MTQSCGRELVQKQRVIKTTPSESANWTREGEKAASQAGQSQSAQRSSSTHGAAQSAQRARMCHRHKLDNLQDDASRGGGGGPALSLSKDPFNLKNGPQ